MLKDNIFMHYFLKVKEQFISLRFFVKFGGTSSIVNK